MISGLVLGLILAAQASTPPPADVVTVAKLTVPERALRFEAVVPGSLDEVWNAFTTREGLSTWLWRDIRVDLRPGGDWIVLYPGGKTGGGTIVSFEPKRRLTLSALAPEQFPTVRRERTTAVFEFEPVSAGETRVTLVQTGWKSGSEWDEAYEYLARGNAILLRQLHRRFSSGPVDWSKLK